MRVARNPKNDPQRNRVYAAEACFRRPSMYDRGLTALQARELIAEVRRHYRLRPPVTLHFVKAKNDWWGMLMEYGYDVVYGTVCPPFRVVVNGQRNLDMQGLLHELAHLVDAVYFSPLRQAHGPTFCGVAGWLYNYYDVIPFVAYEALLKDHGVKYEPPIACSPKAIIQRKGRH